MKFCFFFCLYRFINSSPAFYKMLAIFLQIPRHLFTKRSPSFHKFLAIFLKMLSIFLKFLAIFFKKAASVLQSFRRDAYARIPSCVLPAILLSYISA